MPSNTPQPIRVIDVIKYADENGVQMIRMTEADFRAYVAELVDMALRTNQPIPAGD